MESARDPRIGSELARFRIEALVGRGGMGVVYRARDRSGRKVALKVLPAELSADPGARLRFEREAATVAGLDHPAVIPIYAAGEAEGTLFIAMHYVEGCDLHHLLRATGALPADRALAICEQVAGALDAAHARGIVHRDVKPANVLVETEAPGRCFLTDFGVMRDAAATSGLTAAGQLVGTLEYVAPEQIEGLPLDGRADGYALACVLFECLTGRPPFHAAEKAATIWAHLNEPPPRASAERPELPASVDAVIARQLSKVPEERYESCSTFATAVRDELERGAAAATGERTSVAHDSSVPADRLDRSRAGSAGRARLYLAVAVTTVALGLGLGAGAGTAGEEPSVASSFIRIERPGGWSQARVSVPGLRLSAGVGIAPGGSARRGGVLAGRPPEVYEALMPVGLQERLTRPPTWDGVVFGELRGYRYPGLAVRGLRGRVDLYVAPTSKGAAAIACVRGPQTRRADCERIAASAELVGARQAPLGPDRAYALALRAALRPLFDARAKARRGLARARSADAQVAPARRIAAAFERAARRVSKLDPPLQLLALNNGRFLEDLRNGARNYRRLAAAAQAGDRAAFGTSRAATLSGEARLGEAIALLENAGYTLR